MYQLPRFPAEIAPEEGEEEPRSVFEEIALARFLYPDDEYRVIMMFALYNIYHKSYIPYDKVASQFYGSHDDKPDGYFLYLFGINVDAKVKLDIGNQSCVEVGARFMMKIIKMS